MFVPPIRLTVLLLSLMAAGAAAHATETDQFTTPKTPLHDIGADLSRKVAEILEADRTGDDPEHVLAHWAGHNVMESRLVRWVKAMRTVEDPVTFHPRVFDSVYRVALSPTPASFLFDSPTVHVHGYYLGTDKIDHFFQQGYRYFELVRKYEAGGMDEESAMATAVAYGVKQEHQYYGTLASGIYSNGDLAANYAGMKFYLNLRHSVKIGEQLWPPLLERGPEGWRLRPGVDRERLLAPFFSNHLDESLNPSRYRFSRGSIRSLVRARCERWTQFYSDRLELVAPAEHSFAGTWFGEDYGHWLPPGEEISVATECAAGPVKATKRETRRRGGGRVGTD